MSTQTIRILIAGALFVHSLGHTLGFWRPASSWLLPGASSPTLRIISSIFWMLAIVGFLASSLSFLGIVLPGEWWRALAIIFAIISLAGLILFIGNWPLFNTVGAIGFNVAVLVALLWLAWPPVTMFGK